MSHFQNLSSKINCIIVDDDPFIQDLLQDKLNQHFNDISVKAVASNGKEGIQRINELNPDIVFLDVEMSDMTGFEMLSELKNIMFKTIFITSYNHYAIKAIRFNALDYLLKPFDLEELKNSIERYKEQSKDFNHSQPISRALDNLKSKDTSKQILTLKTQQGVLQLQLKDIIYIEGDGNYSIIHLLKSRKELVSKTLSDLEDLLDEKGFFRCHKSFLVNRIHIISKLNGVSIKLSNDLIVPISRRRKIDFFAWLNTQNNV